MSKIDLGLGLAFLALGLVLAVTSFGFPGGMELLPGPGFFPRVIGVATAGLSVILLRRALRGAQAPGPVENVRTLAVFVGLTGLYLALWGVGGFFPRTTIFLFLLLRMAGEGWMRSAVVSATLTGAVTLGFRLGLRIDLV